MTQELTGINRISFYVFPALKDYSPIKSVDHLLAEICYEFKLKREDLNKRTRAVKYLDARQTAMYLIQKHFRISLKEIGMLFGGYDHTTVIHSRQVVQARIDTEPELRQIIVNIENRMK